MEKRQKIEALFSKVAKKYDLLNNIISFGVCNLWQRKLISKIFRKKTYNNTLDLCTGTGILLPSLSKVSNNLYALDISKEMLEIAKKRCKKQNLEVNFTIGEAENLSYEDDFFDLITVAYGVRNFYDLKKGLSEIKRVLKSDGTLYILEFGKTNKKTIFSLLFTFYFKNIMPLIAKIFLGNKDSYKYLANSVLNFPSNNDFIAILNECSLNCTNVNIMLGGVVYIYEAKKM